MSSLSSSVLSPRTLLRIPLHSRIGFENSRSGAQFHRCASGEGLAEVMRVKEATECTLPLEETEVDDEASQSKVRNQLFMLRISHFLQLSLLSCAAGETRRWPLPCCNPNW